MTISDPKPPPSRPLTPLWVISLFVSLTEAVLGIAVTQTTGGIQVTVTAFVVIFPLLVAAGFFAVLWFKPHHFYAPTEYSQQMSAREYVEAMTQRKPLDENQLYESIQKTIRSTLTSEGIVAELTDTVSRKAGERVEEDVAKILDSAAEKAVEIIREESFLTIDSKPLLGINGKVWQVPYEQYATVSDLLDDIWLSLDAASDTSVPAYTYGKLWALQDVKSGRIFKEMGRSWAHKYGQDMDVRPLKQVGLYPGMNLDAIRL